MVIVTCTFTIQLQHLLQSDEPLNQKFKLDFKNCENYCTTEECGHMRLCFF